MIINVENVNDNFPTFAANTYMFEVEEGASAASLTSVMPAGVTMITVCIFPLTTMSRRISVYLVGSIAKYYLDSSSISAYIFSLFIHPDITRAGH